MKRFLCIWALLIVGCGISEGRAAETVYVTDAFEITLRAGPSVEHRIIRMVPSGVPLEIVERKEGWTRVRIPGREEGTAEGWVLHRYLMDRVPWERQARALREDHATLKEKVPHMEEELKASVQKEQELRRALQERTEAFSRLEDQYETLRAESSEYLELKETSDRMTVALKNSETKVQQLEKENEKLRSSERNRWFLSGALVVVCGLLIGLILGIQQKKRKPLYY